MKKLLFLTPALATVMLTTGCYYTEPAVVVRPGIRPAPVVVRPGPVVVGRGPVVVRPRRW